jgi:hypothetical protein
MVKWAMIVAFALVVWQSAAMAATSASGTVSSQQLGPNSYEYSLNLQNNGTTPIKTFWFGWIVYLGAYPYDLLPSAPTSVVSPSGWNGGALLNDGGFSPGKYGIEWTSATGLAPGASLSGFKFDSPDNPTTIGTQTGFAGYPIRESWVYQGTSQSDAGFEFTPAVAVPEPAVALLVPLGLLLRHRRVR